MSVLRRLWQKYSSFCLSVIVVIPVLIAQYFFAMYKFRLICSWLIIGFLKQNSKTSFIIIKLLNSIFITIIFFIFCFSSTMQLRLEWWTNRRVSSLIIFPQKDYFQDRKFKWRNGYLSSATTSLHRCHLWMDEEMFWNRSLNHLQPYKKIANNDITKLWAQRKLTIVTYTFI